MIRHKDYLLVQVQEEASGFNIVNSLKPPHFEWEYPVDGDDPGTYDCADLPSGTWQLIGVPLGKSVHDKIIPYLKAQQPVDAVTKEAAQIIEELHEILMPLHINPYNLGEEGRIASYIKRLYALFTARHPTPKPGSHDTEGKEGPGC